MLKNATNPPINIIYPNYCASNNNSSIGLFIFGPFKLIFASGISILGALIFKHGIFPSILTLGSFISRPFKLIFPDGTMLYLFGKY